MDNLWIAGVQRSMVRPLEMLSHVVSVCALSRPACVTKVEGGDRFEALSIYR